MEINDSVIGKKVRLCRGMKEKNHFDHMMWCAGTIPIGAIGTIHKDEDNAIAFHIVWDNPEFKAKGRYVYGVTNPADFIELVEE